MRDLQYFSYHYNIEVNGNKDVDQGWDYDKGVMSSQGDNGVDKKPKSFTLDNSRQPRLLSVSLLGWDGSVASCFLEKWNYCYKLQSLICVPCCKIQQSCYIKVLVCATEAFYWIN